VLIYRKNIVVGDQSLESSAPASSAASKHGVLAKSSIVPETAGVKNIASTKDSMKSAAAGNLQSKTSVSKSRFGQDNSEILTTDKLYYSAAALSSTEHEFADGAEVLGNGLENLICIEV